MKRNTIVARQPVAGFSAGCLLAGLAMGIAAAPSAVAAPDCTPDSVNATVSSATGSAAAVPRRASRRQPGSQGRLRAASSGGGDLTFATISPRIRTSTTTCAAFWRRSATPNGSAM